MAPMPRLRPRRHGDDGLTLIEMVVAIGVLMVVLLSSLAVFITVQQSQQTAEGTDRAIQLANSRIERIRQLDWTTAGFTQTGYDTAVAAMSPDAKVTYDSLVPKQDTTSTPESTVLNASAPADLKPYEVTTEARNKFEVFTTITWGTKRYGSESVVQAANRESNTTLAGPEFYSFKRVRITVVWKSNGTGATHKTVNESWFSPKGYQEVPPSIPVHTDTYSPPPPTPSPTPTTPPPPYCATPITSGTTTGTTDPHGVFTIDFGKTFSSAPAVVASAVALNGSSSQITLVSVTTTGFTAYLMRNGTPIAGATVKVHWMASNDACLTPDMFQNGASTAATAASGVVTVTFPQAFTTVPVVTASTASYYGLAIMPGTVTKTGFQAQVRDGVGNPLAAGQNVTVDWMATPSRDTVNPVPISVGSNTGTLTGGRMRIAFGQTFPSAPAVVATGADGTTNTCANCGNPNSGEVVSITDVTATDFGIQVNAVTGAQYTTNTVHINWIAKTGATQTPPPPVPSPTPTQTCTSQTLTGQSYSGTIAGNSLAQITFATTYPTPPTLANVRNAVTGMPINSGNIQNITTTGFQIKNLNSAGKPFRVTYDVTGIICSTPVPASPPPMPATSFCPSPLASGVGYITADASGNTTFSFGTTFATAPVVVVTPVEDGLYTLVASIVSVSTTGFTVAFRQPDGSPMLSGATGYIHWMATPYQCQTAPQFDDANTVVVTNASGVAWVPFTQNFPTAPVVTATGGNGEQVVINTQANTNGFYATFRRPGGAAIVGAVRVHYLAALAQNRTDDYPMAANNNVVSTDSNGQAFFSFGQTFTGTPNVVATGGNGELVKIVSTTLSGFTARFVNLQGTPIVGAVRLLWIAKQTGVYTTPTDRLNAGSTLAVGKYLLSNDNQYLAYVQSDGNFVVYDMVPTQRALWGTGTYGSAPISLTLSSAGDLALKGGATTLWNTNTTGTGNYLIMQTDGNLVLYNAAGDALWASNTRQP